MRNIIHIQARDGTHTGRGRDTGTRFKIYLGYKRALLVQIIKHITLHKRTLYKGVILSII